MVIDSSAVLAIILEEPAAEYYAVQIAAAETRLMSVASFVEIGLRLIYLSGTLGTPTLEVFVLRSKIELVPVDEDQARVALHAFEKYGKGRHKAALNFGDCFSYALAKVRQERLLYQGNDFSQTDLA